MSKAWPDWSTGSVRSMYGQVFRFAHEMQIGDAVILPVKHTRQIAIGRVTGPCVHHPDLGQNDSFDYSNSRSVEWLKHIPRTNFSQNALHSFGSFTTVSTSNDHLEEILLQLSSDENETGVSHTTATSLQPSVPVNAILDDTSGDSSSNLFEAAHQETEDFLLKEWIRTGAAFEHVVAGVMEAIGYTAKVTQASGDHGVDVIAHPDPLGLQPPFIKIQAKSGTSTVGEPEVSQLIGTLSEGEKGILIGLGGFSRQAEARARHSSKVSLIGPADFVELFLDHYDQLDPKWRTRFPLQRVYVPSL